MTDKKSNPYLPPEPVATPGSSEKPLWFANAWVAGFFAAAEHKDLDTL